MLTLVGDQHRLCDRIPRRAFLKIGALGGLTLADVLRLEAGQPAAQANRKSVILIFLEGGASHLDTYDLKRAAPADHVYDEVFTAFPRGTPRPAFGSLVSRFSPAPACGLPAYVGLSRPLAAEQPLY